MKLLPLYTHDVFLLNPGPGSPKNAYGHGSVTGLGWGGGEDQARGDGAVPRLGFGSGEARGRREGRYIHNSLSMIDEEDLFEIPGDGYTANEDVPAYQLHPIGKPP